MQDSTAPLDDRLAGRLAALALGCVHREYPNKIAHVLEGDADARPPRELTPAFYGCFDWHSAVHGHWLLVRLARAFPGAAWAAQARAAVARSLTRPNIQGEVRYLQGAGRTAFERPYGLAWLLQLAAELRQAQADAELQDHSGALAPLELLAAQRLSAWLPRLPRPIRTGTHDQTAFALGLVLDWARSAGDQAMQSLILARAADFYGADTDAPLGYEPSGHDFLSPALAEADLMRRVQPPAAFAAWLQAFLPGIPADGRGTWLQPVHSPDPADGHLAHLDGLNLSRAWMLQGIAHGLPSADPRRPALLAAAAAHQAPGLQAVTGQHYEGGHWLGSFAVYLLTGRGLASAPSSQE